MKLAPICRFCAKTITKRFSYIEFGEQQWKRQEVITTKEEAQKLTNELVVSVTVNSNGRVLLAKTWDGESFRDEHFCKDRCAMLFGRMVAEHRPNIATAAYFEKLEKRKDK